MSNVDVGPGLADFSFELYKAIEKDGNEFISPFSIASALLLLMLGTGGTTKNQLQTSIFKENIPSDIHNSYKELNEKLLSRTRENVTLSIANRLFGNKNKVTQILDSYKSDALRYYNSALEQLDLERELEASRQRINDWVEQQTRDKIKNIIPRGGINQDTLLVLVNAVYFKGTWANQFNSTQTKKRTFFINRNVKTRVDMMYSKRFSLVGKHMKLKCKVLKLPFLGNKISMVFVLPNRRNGLKRLERRLTSTNFNALLDTMRSQETIIRIPKFKIEEKYDLKPILNKIGIREIFQCSKADFSMMTQSNVCTSSAVHKSFVVVNEEGSEAAAATAITVGVTSVGPKPRVFRFIANHPFLFILRDDERGTILFMGRYVNPQ